MNKIPLTIKELKSNTEFNYDVYTKEALISTIVTVRDYFSDLEKESKQLKEKLETSERARKEAIDYINFLVIIDAQLAGGRFKDTIWGKELLEILDTDKGE